MLQIQKIHKTFFQNTPNEIHALKGIDLEIEEGSFTIVIGTNGSGKSTLLNAVAGSFFVDSGSLHLVGRNITRWAEHRRAKLIGRVFQNPFSGTAPSMTIAENLALAIRRGQRRTLKWALGRTTRNIIREQVAELRMGLEDRIDNPIGTLSGGQRQALTLLMASWKRPDLLLLDEHTAALDPRSAEQVIQMTDAVIRREKLTTLMVTHSMQQAVNLGDRLVMVHRGRIIDDIRGGQKRRLRPKELLDRFEVVQNEERMDPSAAELLARNYI